MPLSDDEFKEAVMAICPHCRAGNLPRKRTDTGEFVHDNSPIIKAQSSHTICWASGLIQSRFNPQGQVTT